MASFLTPMPHALDQTGISTHQGLNDWIPLALADKLASSLCLIRVDRLVLTVFAPGEAFGNKNAASMGTSSTTVLITRFGSLIPATSAPIWPWTDGDYALGGCFLTISLGEAFNDSDLQTNCRNHPGRVEGRCPWTRNSIHHRAFESCDRGLHQHFSKARDHCAGRRAFGALQPFPSAVQQGRSGALAQGRGHPVRVPWEGARCKLR